MGQSGDRFYCRQEVSFSVVAKHSGADAHGDDKPEKRNSLGARKCPFPKRVGRIIAIFVHFELQPLKPLDRLHGAV